MRMGKPRPTVAEVQLQSHSTVFKDCAWPMALRRSHKSTKWILRSERLVQHLALSLFVVSQIPGERCQGQPADLERALPVLVILYREKLGGQNSKRLALQRHGTLVLHWPLVPPAAGHQAGRLSPQGHIPL